MQLAAAPDGAPGRIDRLVLFKDQGLTAPQAGLNADNKVARYRNIKYIIKSRTWHTRLERTDPSGKLVSIATGRPYSTKKQISYYI